MTVPNPTIKEILSETFTKPFTWNARTTRVIVAGGTGS